MLKETRKLFHIILIAVVASLALAPAARAAYDYNMKITVDHTRVGGTDATPPAGYGFVKRIAIDNTKVSGTSDLTGFPVLVSIQNDPTLRTTANGGLVTDPEGDDLFVLADTMLAQESCGHRAVLLIDPDLDPVVFYRPSQVPDQVAVMLHLVLE